MNESSRPDWLKQNEEPRVNRRKRRMEYFMVNSTDWANKKIRMISPLNDWQRPEDLGAMAAYLASVKARQITGQVINVDGGQVMHA
ncbi:MAG: SDR family oxidoreductase [Limisphaerales bacterium]|tara:strand:- start:1289 stop:1546 length:258 start_codon:yes stop_codon:yes gene_type:complete